MNNLNSKTHKTRRFSRTVLILLLVLITLVLLGVLGITLGQQWYTKAISDPASADSSIVEITIKSGTSAVDIGKLLKDKGLINDELAWQIYVRLNNSDFLADTYDLPKNLSIEAIASVLRTGQEDPVIWVTIPEGLRMDEIETILSNKLSSISGSKYDKTTFHSLINSPDTFLASTTSKAGAYISGLKPSGSALEGFLFPDTYAFRTDITAEKVLTTLLENFMTKTQDITVNNGLTFYKSLVLSSIVEKEATASDYSGVASVLLKRIDQGEKLGCDVTVLYILKRWQPEPTANELKIDSPYNTRLNYGIPPTPILNPGVAAIKATAEAKPGDYLFFIADENGNIHYGKTLADHNYNICKYINKTCQ